MNIQKTAVGTALLLACGGAFISLAQAPKEAPATVEKADLRSKMKLDSAPLPGGGQMQMSYAGVVDKILPSVVRVTPSVRMGGGQLGMGGGHGGRDMEEMQREFLRRFCGGVPEGFGSDEEESPSPRGRGKGGEGKLQKGTGSGVVITTDGYILTNNHVIEDAEKIEVTIGGNGKSHVAKLIGADPRTDVALIKIEATGLAAAVIGDSSKLHVGDVVLAAGSPMELSQSVTMGIVSAMGRRGIGLSGGGAGIQDFIQTDASINPGNSGGPLVDATGRVVGINTAILSRSGMNAGIGFSIPINLALSIVEDLVDDGEVTRGFLGITMENLQEGYGKILGLEADEGVMVKGVTPGSPAEKAGFEPGDVVVAAGGQKVDDNMSLSSIVGVSRPGTKVAFDVFRDGKRIAITATLEAISDEELMAGGRSPKGKPGPGNEEIKKAAPSEIIPGVTVQDLTAGLRDRYSVPEGVTGVVVLRVEPNSAAAGAGLTEGDVITTINTTKVTNMASTKGIEKLGEEPIFLRINREGRKDSIIVPVAE